MRGEQPLQFDGVTDQHLDSWMLGPQVLGQYPVDLDRHMAPTGTEPALDCGRDRPGAWPELDHDRLTGTGYHGGQPSRQLRRARRHCAHRGWAAHDGG